MPRRRPATTDHHPAVHRGRRRTRRAPAVPGGVRLIPEDTAEAVIALGKQQVKLTNLQKPFWPALGITKGDLLQYYVEVAPVLLPHLHGRAMVMKRYPNGAGGEFFFMKRAPQPRPDWIEICSIEHASGNVIDFPMVQDLPSLLWVVNLGCIDLNQWYARCDDVDRPDYVHFDLDPYEGAPFSQVLESAQILHETLEGLGMPDLVKTTGSRGLHIYVPIERGPTQKQVWEFAKTVARELALRHANIMTSEYRLSKRPVRRVLVDYNQNAWGRTLASVYSVRPSPRAGVSTPITWAELARGVAIDDFRLDNVPARIRRVGDLWAPLLASRGRFKLERYL